MIGMIFMLFLMCVIVFEAIISGNIIDNLSNARLIDFRGISVTFPIAAVSFSCHPNILGIYHELARRSIRRISKVVRRTMMGATVIFSTIGVCGYLIFCDKI